MPKATKITALLNANHPGERYIGFQHANGRLVIARRADRHTMLLGAKEAQPIVEALYADPADTDQILSVALGDWQSELRSARVLSADGERLACYA